ncbi:arrestin domain-containing protein 3-like [Saccostrea cucullata]|uniref:arrestin domain-containing protein 3-like n=1 Tax=Saccostrea cuccullata TaxID=36930 RepID=UPI002ED347B0
MGKLKAFFIELENSDGVFSPGQTINGKLVIELNEEMKMREIRWTIKGLAYVHWSESKTTGTGGNSRTETVYYTATENYFDYTEPVFGRGVEMGDKNCLPAGQHVFPFAFSLPQNIPSSFEGGVGYVRYTIKGTIDKPWKFDHTTKRPFTVITSLDLNTQPTASHSHQNVDIKYLCCLCCKSGPIMGLLKLDRSGYVPGEAIYFNAEVQNMTTRVCKILAKLYMTTVFHTAKKSKTTHSEVAKVVYQDIRPGDTETWSGRLIVPPLPPSHLQGCRIIDPTYYLELIVDPSGPAFDLHVPVLVIIGTIPLYSVVEQYRTLHGFSAPEQPELPPTHTATPVTTNVGAAPTTNLPPPSYSECVFGKTNIREESDSEHTKGQMDFAPAYVYRVFHNICHTSKWAQFEY